VVSSWGGKKKRINRIMSTDVRRRLKAMKKGMSIKEQNIYYHHRKNGQ